MVKTTASTPDHTYVVIGTGFSGICMAARLNMAGRKDYVIYERSDQVGGVWRDNTYPGSACDVPSHLYSYSFFQKPNWTRRFPPQIEIKQYLKDIYEKEKLEQRTEFNREVESLKWNEEHHYWDIKCRGGKNASARYVIAGTGQMPAISIPRIKNLERFKGQYFHSARWNHDIDLSDKKVVVVGTGASAIQFIPEVTKVAKFTTVLQRSAPWVIAKNDREISPSIQSLFSKWPMIQTAYRKYLYLKLEIRGLAFFTFNSLLNIAKWDALKNINKSITNPELKEKVTPDYDIGCKRILVSDDYYEALASENVNLVNSEIVEATDNQVITKNGGRHDADVLILGTGFAGIIPMPGIEVTGISGKNLHEEWKNDGAESFFGVSNSGYPNLFTLIGPNSGLGHNSVLYILESQVDHILKVLNLAESNDSNYINVTAGAQAKFNQKVQGRMTKMVWQTGGCTSWYHNSEGKNISLWPTYTFTFRKESLSVDESEFSFTPPR